MNLGIAYAYAKLGFAVFPLAAKSKIPQIAKDKGGRGCHDATHDLDQIDAWWKKYPNANVGMATGPLSKCWVLDVDPESSKDGEEWLAAMVAKHGPLPVTPEARTLKGGRHLLFAWDDSRPVGNRGNLRVDDKPLKGLDVRGDGGYIVAAPSYVEEYKYGREWAGKYAWLDDRKPSATPLADAPDWLYDAILNKAQTQTQVEFVPRERRQGDGFHYGHKALDAECQAIMTAAPGGQDNQIVSSCFRIGQLVAGGEIPQQEAEASLINAAMAIPAQSKSLSEITDKVKRAMGAGEEKPRSAPRQPERPQGRAKPALKVVGGSAAPDAEPSFDPETGEVYESDLGEWARNINWSLTEKGGLKPQSLNNIRLMLTYHPAFEGRLSLNRFSYEVWVTSALPCDNGEPVPRTIQDHDFVAIAAWLNTVGLTPGDSTVASVVGLVASRHSFDPVEEYLESLSWDGVSRIEKWLPYYLGAERTPYTDLIGPRFLISAVARVLQPGCKVDTMLVLEGPQGIKKSTAARALFGSQWFSDQVGDVTSKESSIQIQGLWAVEVAEMDQFSRADDKAVKSFLSRQDDRYRPVHGRTTILRPRRTVFVGTINPEGSGWIKDSTGGRRYWPVVAASIDIPAILNDRDQLWAEAVVRFRAGDRWWLEADEEKTARAEQSVRQVQDMWDDVVEQFLTEHLPGSFFRSRDVAKAIGVATDRQDQGVQIRIGKILARMGCVPVKPFRDGKQVRGWEKPNPDSEE